MTTYGEYKDCPINISSGIGTKIKDLANIIAQELNYTGTFIWDTSMPNGQNIKIFDVTKLNSFGLFCSTDLRTGIRKTIDFYKLHYG